MIESRAYKPNLQEKQKNHFNLHSQSESPPSIVNYPTRRNRPNLTDSASFRLEYNQNVPRAALKDDVISYIKEYRLKVKITEYDLLFSQGVEGHHIRDMHRGNAMVDAAKRSIAKGDKLNRRIAEHKALQIEDDFLVKAEEGDIIVQGSPPGPDKREDGTYGFIFIRKIEVKGNEKILHNTVIRVEDPTIEQYNTVFSSITGKKIEYTKAEDFIESPFYIGQKCQVPDIQKAISATFNFEVTDVEKQRNEHIISLMDDHIEVFVDMVKQGFEKNDLIQTLHALENCALALQKNQEMQTTNRRNHKDLTLPRGKVGPVSQNIAALKQQYGFEPPKEGGSCGSTGGASKYGEDSIINSLTGDSNLFGSKTKLESDTSGFSKESLNGCGDCGKSGSDNHYHCPDCKKKYSDETNSSNRTKNCSCGFTFRC